MTPEKSLTDYIIQIILMTNSTITPFMALFQFYIRGKMVILRLMVSFGQILQTLSSTSLLTINTELRIGTANVEPSNSLSSSLFLRKLNATNNF